VNSSQQGDGGALVSSDEEETVHFAPEQHFREAVSELFQRVRSHLETLVPSADVQHVGSTAIPGSLTKGDLDVQVRVPYSEYEAAKEKLSRVYGINTGGFASHDAISFEDLGGQHSLGIHLTVIGGTADIQWKFRDALVASAVLRERYDQLKRKFEGRSMESYREAKAEFVSRVLEGLR
jgi:GrpB-like predicted nucleotidyltransferase (UPF0157 family)